MGNKFSILFVEMVSSALKGRTGKNLLGNEFSQKGFNSFHVRIFFQ